MLKILGSWQGWQGETVVKLTDGSTWRQSEYYYQYKYDYRPDVVVTNQNRMLVAGMNKSVRVERIL